MYVSSSKWNNKILINEQGSNENEYGTERNETKHGDAGWWMEQFKNADLDTSGALNLYEFRE